MPRLKSEGNFTNTSLRLETSLFERGETYWREHLFKHRGEMYAAALKNFMDETECPFCGARNPKGGRVCSVCMRPLTIDDEIYLTVNLINKEKEELEQL